MPEEASTEAKDRFLFALGFLGKKVNILKDERTHTRCLLTAVLRLLLLLLVFYYYKVIGTTTTTTTTTIDYKIVHPVLVEGLAFYR